MTQAKIDEIFGDDRFAGQLIETVYAATTHNRNDESVRLIVVNYPLYDMMHYRLEVGSEKIRLFTKFRDALRAFREVL